MGLPVSLLYLDACCIIYLVEASSPFHGNPSASGVVWGVEGHERPWHARSHAQAPSPEPVDLPR
jgi:hypothetical protein